jgi:hypothetical protein
MAIPHWLIGLLILALPAAFVIFAFRQGLKVKPDPDKRHDHHDQNVTGGYGGYDGHGGHDGHAG